jgi:putative nucleotidyltransferase with HDIG domain
MTLPTAEECLSYFDELNVPLNVKEHCLKVRDVAATIAKKIKVDKINLTLVEATALTHDLFKPLTYNLEPSELHDYEHTKEEIESWDKLKTIYGKMQENEVAYHFFKDKYPLLAETLKNSASLTKGELNWNELIVHYADWRVLKNEIVSLDERYNYLELQYPEKKKFFKEYLELMKKEEKLIFAKLKFNPEELNKVIESEQ